MRICQAPFYGFVPRGAPQVASHRLWCMQRGSLPDACVSVSQSVSQSLSQSRAAAAPADVFLKKNKKIGNAQRATWETKTNLDGQSCSCSCSCAAAAVAAARWVVRPLGLRRTTRGAPPTHPHQYPGGAWQPQGLVWVGGWVVRPWGCVAPSEAHHTPKLQLQLQLTYTNILK